MDIEKLTNEIWKDTGAWMTVERAKIVAAKVQLLIEQAKKDEREHFSKLSELCGKVIELTFHGDYTNGNDAFGVDEGRVRAMECLEQYEKDWQSLQDKVAPQEESK